MWFVRDTSAVINWLRYLAARGSAKKYAAIKEVSSALAMSIASSRLETETMINVGSVNFLFKMDLSLNRMLVDANTSSQLIALTCLERNSLMLPLALIDSVMRFAPLESCSRTSCSWTRLALLKDSAERFCERQCTAAWQNCRHLERNKKSELALQKNRRELVFA
jgi:hypothetical protein